MTLIHAIKLIELMTGKQVTLISYDDQEVKAQYKFKFQLKEDGTTVYYKDFSQLCHDFSI